MDSFVKHNTDQEIVKAVNLGQYLNRQKTIKEKEQKDCNHLKGGLCEVKGGKYTGKVFNNMNPPSFKDYAVIKHKMPWGDWWIRCLRCGRWWKPGDFDYNEALAFTTHNSPSTAIQFDLPPENLAVARELTRGT